MVAHSLLFFVPRISAYPQHVVIGEASAPERLGKNLLLLWRWVKPKPICFLDIHLHTIYYLCEIVNRDGNATSKPSPYLPTAKAGGITETFMNYESDMREAFETWKGNEGKALDAGRSEFDVWKAATEQSQQRITELESELLSTRLAADTQAYIAQDKLAAQQALVCHLMPTLKMSDKGQEELAAIKAAEYQRGVDSCAISTAAAYEGGKQAGREERDKELMEQEPVAWQGVAGHLVYDTKSLMPSTRHLAKPLYAEPFPQQKPLSEEVVLKIAQNTVRSYKMDAEDWIDYTRAVEAAHGIIGEKK